jgi:glutathione synthase/RimK-type ligase-like ATP-grasp enzyme
MTSSRAEEGAARRVAFVTRASLPAGAADDHHAAAELARRGFGVDHVAWDDPGADWGEYAAILLRSTWDYHLRLTEFFDWLRGLERERLPLWNPPDLVRWNARKTYLRELEEAGFRVPKTLWATPGSTSSLRRLFEESGWEQAVVKPVVSASAAGTELVARGEAASREESFARLRDEHGVMVQELRAEIRERGELSLMFFDRQFSHAVRKRPRAGEFRVQEHHGGTAEPAMAAEATVEAARSVLEVIGGGHLYARVDLIEDGLVPILMEVELIEPSLFFALDRESPARFAETLERRLS